MTEARWREVTRLYHAALAVPLSDRSEFLKAACNGDLALVGEVESLLSQPGSADDFLAKPMVSHSGVPFHPVPWTGRRIGVYVVHELLGAGGMGEVYRARDTRLGRDVALKVLPRDMSSDPERLARFNREAQLLAVLNHPHIAALYGVEDVPDDGPGAPAATALVLELVEGPTLADRLKRSAMPLAGTIAAARQIADALDAAHAAGIVHRDLKPANIKLRDDGTIKVLDFGLAKAMSSRSNVPASRADSGLTRVGTIQGTAAYMSPEQVRGQAVDHRTDVWAFGCVLYEMLTGHTAFGADTPSDTIAAILDRDPDLSRLPFSTPPALRRLLKRCLAKDPKKRLRDIGDVVLDLDEALEPAPTVPAARRRWPAVAAAVRCSPGSR
jgi:serine/threonine-protein kinase